MVTDITAEIVSSVILLPIVWFLLKSTKRYIDKTTKVFEEGFNKLVYEQKQFREEHVQLHSLLVKEIAYSVGRTSLTKTQALDIVREKGWYTCEKKVMYIKEILIKNDLQNRKEMIMKSISAEFTRLVNTTIDELSTFTSELGNLGDILMKYSQEEKLLQEIFDIIFRKSEGKDKVYEIELKINDIRTIMKNYQNELISNLKKDY